MKEFLYIILRHGSNAANQSMTQTAAVGTVKAQSLAEAVKQFRAAGTVTIYANQRLEAVAWSRAARWQQEAAQEADLYASAA